MEIIKNYIPDEYVFELPENNPFPTQIFDEATTIDEARKMIAERFVAMNCAVTAARRMDNHEIAEVRKKYIEALECTLPELKEKANVAKQELERAKEREKEAAQIAQACFSMVVELSAYAKQGITDMEIAPNETFQIPCDGKYAYYAWVDNKVMLVKVEEIPSFQKNDLLNSCNTNNEKMAEISEMIKSEAV